MTLTTETIAALFGTMIVLALLPSVSALAVSARSAAFGFAHGVVTTIGIITGDIVFIVIAIYGLSLLAQAMGTDFVLIKYLGGAYLMWLGIALWRSKPKTDVVDDGKGSSLRASFLTGLLITLGDQKAIVFYLGFFPAFVNLSTLTVTDTLVIVAIAAVAIAAAKLAYAFVAHKARSRLGNAWAAKGLNLVAGGMMVVVGFLLIVQAIRV